MAPPNVDSKNLKRDNICEYHKVKKCTTVRTLIFPFMDIWNPYKFILSDPFIIIVWIWIHMIVGFGSQQCDKPYLAIYKIIFELGF